MHALRTFVRATLATGLVAGALAAPCSALAADADVALVSVTPTAAGATAGEDFTWEITVSSYGPDATAATLTDQLGEGETLVKAEPSQGSCTQTAPVTCSLGAVAPAAFATVRVTVKESKGGTVFHSATVAGADADVDPSNNTARGNVEVSDPVAPVTPKVKTGVTDVNNQVSLRFTADVTSETVGALHFQYGATKAYGKQTPNVVVPGTGYGTLKAKAGGLAINTVYHYRAVLVVDGKTYLGLDLTARTAPVSWPKNVKIKATVGRTSTLVSGTVVRPAWVDAPGACSGKIGIVVYTLAGSNLLVKQTPLHADCTYSLRIAFGTAQARAAGKKGFVLLQSNFPGNRAMSRQGSISLRI